jgi:L-amino acid N-acyltransferase YncA
MMQIVPMLPEHWLAVRDIYENGIATGNATFQTFAPSWEEWNANHLLHSRLVTNTGDKIVGWAALTPVSGRCVYAGVAEVSVYVDAEYRGQKIGEKLLSTLIEESEKNGIWTLQAGIFPENIPSIKIHQNGGFKIIGTRERIGQMNGIWRDTVLLERRSLVVGI